MKITPVETCGDCNGTGADYDDRCRAIACRACGGSGMVETSPRQSLIDSMIDARSKLLAMADAPATEGLPVLYYPPALVERAKIFWAGAYRIEPVVPMPTVTPEAGSTED